MISTNAHAHACPHTHPRTHIHTRPQFNCKTRCLGFYEVEEDAAAARDAVANVLGRSLNFQTPRKVMGQRSEGSDQAVADAVKAANGLVLGNLVTFGVLANKLQNS